MTKSTITRERLEEIVSDPMINQGSEFAMMARMALAAMDSEPHTDDELSNLLWYSQEAACHSDPNYYCEFQRLATPGLIAGIIRELHERRKVDSEPVAIIDQANLDYLRSGADADVWPPEREEMGDVLLYRHPQPAPVVPEEKPIPNTLSMYAVDAVAAIAEVKGWNACRAAMLQAGNHPAQSDFCPAQNSINPAQGGNSLVIPDEMTSGQAYEIGYYYGDPVDVFARGANWMRQHIIDSTLAAAPQSPGSEPATVPGKWIPVSERMPEEVGRYWCYVEEQNSLGKSHYQWNCSWNGDAWSDKALTGRVTHWMPLPAAPQEVKGE